MDYIISDTVMESLQNAQALQEVSILLNEATQHTPLYEINAHINTKLNADKFVSNLESIRDILMSRFDWSKYRDDRVQFDRLYVSLGVVKQIIEEHWVLQ